MLNLVTVVKLVACVTSLLFNKFFVQIGPKLLWCYIRIQKRLTVISAAPRREEMFSLMVPGCKLQERVEFNEL